MSILMVFKAYSVISEERKRLRNLSQQFKVSRFCSKQQYLSNYENVLFK